MSFEKLRALQLAGSEAGGPVTPVYPALEVARAYQALTASWDTLLLVFSQTDRELSQSLALLQSELDVDAAWSELCQEAHEVLFTFLEQPEPPTLGSVLETLEQLEAGFLELDLKSCYERLEASSAQVRLAGFLERDIPESELVEGHYTWLEAALHRWLEGELETEPLCALIHEHQARVEGQLEEYEATYLSAEEWTMEVALGDRLLLEGLNGWRDGLSLLLLAVSRGQLPRVDEALLLLLEGNRKLIQVQVLQAQVN